MRLRFVQRAHVDFTDKTARALRDDSLHGVGHILRTERPGRVLGGTAGEFRGGAAGTNHADTNSVIAEIFGHTTGKTDDSPFGGAINAAVGEGVFARQGTDVDNIAGAAADHGGHDGSGNEKDALQVGVVNAVPFFLGLLMSGTEEANASVIHENGDRSESGFCFRDKAGDIRGKSHVGNRRENANAGVAKRLGGVRERRAIPAADGHGGSERSKTLCDGAAYAAAGAGNQRHAAGEQFLFGGYCICCTYSSHQNSSSTGPLFLCETHLITSVFRGTWDPGGCEGNRWNSAASTENDFQVNTSVFDNGLRMQGGIPYNPNVSETMRFPVEVFRGAPQEENPGTELERGEMGMNGIRKVTGLAMVAGLCLILGNGLAVCAQAPAAGQDATAPKYTMAEYNAYQACAAEKAPAALLKCLDDFVSKYPNSTLLNYVYPLYYQAYSAQKNYAKMMESADKLAALGGVDALTRFNAYYSHVAAYSAMITDSAQTNTG